MLSKILAFVFALGALIFLYLAFKVDSSYAIYMVPFAVVVAVIYVLSPQIDWWKAQKKPPEIDARLRKLLHENFAFYHHLSVDGKQRFRDRMALFMLAHDYMPMAMESVPEDIKGIVAANAVQLTFGQQDFLLEKFEKVILYPHPFPSPQFPEHLHASETYAEDGVVIFSIQHLMNGFLRPKQYFNVGLHEYAQVFMLSYPNLDYPEPGEDIWEKLEQIGGYDKEKLQDWLGLPSLNPLSISMVYFFTYPAEFRRLLPKLFEQYSELFNLNLLEAHQPIRYVNQI